MIKITNLNKYFYRRKSNQIHVINSANISFPETGLVTILGESGSGKTTLLNVIGGLDNFYSGSIEYDDVKLSKYSSSKIDRIRNEKIGYIFQNYLLLQQRTVYENLHILLNMYDISEAEKSERIDYVLKAVGMLRYKKKNVTELSGGQQQRVAIARALIKSPALILADEPTGNLDEKNTIQIMNIIKKISKTTLVILVSHEKSIATSYSDYIIEVSDGKIVDEKNVSSDSFYQYEDNRNIYLKEFEYTQIENENVSIDFYSNEKKKINLQIINHNGKFYIKSSNDVILLNENSEIKVIEEHRKPLDIEAEAIENDYELKPLEFKRTPHLTFKEVVRLAFSNLKKTKKRVTFLSIPLFLIVILTIFSVQSVVAASKVDKQHLVFTHSKINTIFFDAGDSTVNKYMAQYGFEYFYDEFFEANPNIDIVLDHPVTFSFTLPTFDQMLNKKYELGGHSILSTKFISEDELLYGRMPQNATEIVIEKWVIENSIENSTLNNFLTVEGFLGRELWLKGKDYPYKVVGVADTNENAVYMSDWALFDIYPSAIKVKSTSVCSVSEFLKYEGTPDELSLAPNTAVGNLKYEFEHEYLDLFINEDKNLQFDVIDNIDFGDCPFRFVVPDDVYDKIVKSVSVYNHERMFIYCDNEEEVNQVKEYIDSVKDFYESGDIKIDEEDAEKYGDKGGWIDVKMILSFRSTYHEVIDPYVLEANKVVASRTLITITIVLLSVIIVFFSMKSLSIKNIYDIGVYRAIGISKSSIVWIYAIEVFVISIKTTFIGGVLCYLITNFISNIPIINSDIAIDFNVFASITLGLIFLNVLVGILPVSLNLRKTPSQILTKYDI